MMLSKEQSQSLQDALKASGKPLAFIARKYDLSYNSLRYWVRGGYVPRLVSQNKNRFQVYLAAINNEIGWKP